MVSRCLRLFHSGMVTSAHATVGWQVPHTTCRVVASNPLGPNYGGLLRLQQAPYDIQFLIMQGSFASVAKPAAVQG